MTKSCRIPSLSDHSSWLREEDLPLDVVVEAKVGRVVAFGETTSE